MPIKSLVKSFFILPVLSAFLLFGISCAPLQVIDPLSMQSNGSSQFTGVSLNQRSSRSVSRSHKNIYYKSFPNVKNQPVQKWLNHFSRGEGQPHMRRYLERSSRYMDFMGDIFQKEGLPRDLVYMAMAESGFNPTAKSSAKAVGYWQFIHATGKSYGLRIDSAVDERQDVVHSTKAAVNYLKDLYDEFEDWLLSMAGYNCGESCVRQAIAKHKSWDFWYLAEKKALPPETRNYVPKVIAMRTIALNPKAYGFSSLNYKEPLDYTLVSLRGPASLNSISQQLQVPYGELRSLNPQFKTDRIPDEDHFIRIPTHVR